MIPNKNSSLRGYGHWPSSTEQPRVQERETGLRHWRTRFFVFLVFFPQSGGNHLRGWKFTLLWVHAPGAAPITNSISSVPWYLGSRYNLDNRHKNARSEKDIPPPISFHRNHPQFDPCYYILSDPTSGETQNWTDKTHARTLQGLKTPVITLGII